MAHEETTETAEQREARAEAIRLDWLVLINSNPQQYDVLAKHFGTDNVWTLLDLAERFEIIGFSAPFACVQRRSDGLVGSVLFQHCPRYYFGFEPYDGNELKSIGTPEQRGMVQS